MNKNDFKLIIILLIIACSFLFVFKLTEKNNNKKAIIYYEDEIILKVDLNIDKKYQVNGYNGIVDIVVKDGKIKVENENSPLHLCSNQGYINSTYETIVCLPNRITIKIESSENDLDTVVK